MGRRLFPGRKAAICLALLLLAVISGGSSNAALASEMPENEVSGRVLFISSYSYAWETVSLQIDGILGICLCIFYHNLSGNICPVVYHLPAFR